MSERQNLNSSPVFLSEGDSTMSVLMKVILAGLVKAAAFVIIWIILNY